MIAIGVFGILGGSLGFVFSGGLRLVALGVGVLFVFVGVAIVAPRVVKPITRVVDPVATWSVVVLSVLVYPLTLLFWLIARPFRKRPAFPRVMRDRTANSLAERNVQRNPSRTALAAAALMIGLALVTFVAVLAAGLKSTFESAVTKQFNADYALDLAERLHAHGHLLGRRRCGSCPQVTTAAGVRAGRGKEFGDQFDVTAVDPGISKVLKLRWKDGLAGDARDAREHGRGRERVVREEARPRRRLAAPRADAVREGPEPAGGRHLQGAGRRLAVRLGHDLGGQVRRELPEPAERVHADQHQGRRDARRTRRS